MQQVFITTAGEKRATKAEKNKVEKKEKERAMNHAITFLQLILNFKKMKISAKQITTTR